MASLKSNTVRKLEATRFVIHSNFTMKVDPIGVVSFFYDKGTVEIVEVPKHICKIGLMDKVFLTKDASAYDPAAEATAALSRGCSEFVAVTIGFLRGLIITSKNLKVAKAAIQIIPQLNGKIEVKPETAEALIDAASFWYSAYSWLSKYATIRANAGFTKDRSMDETLLPWLMKAYAKDAHMPILISNFIRQCLFAPFQVESLITCYARNLEADAEWNLPKMYRETFKSPLNEACAKLSLAYNMLKMLVKKSEFTAILPESELVMRQLLFAFEVAVSAAVDRVPVYAAFDKLLDLEIIAELDETLVFLNTMLRMSKYEALTKFSKVLTVKFGVLTDVAYEKVLMKSFKQAKKGDTFGEFHVILGKLSAVIQLSIV